MPGGVIRGTATCTRSYKPHARLAPHAATHLATASVRTEQRSAWQPWLRPWKCPWLCPWKYPPTWLLRRRLGARQQRAHHLACRYGSGTAQAGRLQRWHRCAGHVHCPAGHRSVQRTAAAQRMLSASRTGQEVRCRSGCSCSSMALTAAGLAQLQRSHSCSPLTAAALTSLHAGQDARHVLALVRLHSRTIE